MDLITIGGLRVTDGAFDPVLKTQHFFFQRQVILKAGLLRLVGSAGNLVDVVGDVAQKEDNGFQFRFDAGGNEVAPFGVGERKSFEACGRLHFQTLGAFFDCGVFGLRQCAVDALYSGAVVKTRIHFAPHVLPKFGGRGTVHIGEGKAARFARLLRLPGIHGCPGKRAGDVQKGASPFLAR